MNYRYVLNLSKTHINRNKENYEEGESFNKCKLETLLLEHFDERYSSMVSRKKTSQTNQVSCVYFTFKNQLKHIDLNLKTFAFLSKKASSEMPKASKPSSIVPLSNTPCAEKLILTFICNVRSSCLYNLE